MIKYHISFTCLKDGVLNNGDCVHDRNCLISNKSDIDSLKENIRLMFSADKDTMVITNIIRLPV